MDTKVEYFKFQYNYEVINKIAQEHFPDLHEGHAIVMKILFEAREGLILIPVEAVKEVTIDEAARSAQESMSSLADYAKQGTMGKYIERYCNGQADQIDLSSIYPEKEYYSDRVVAFRWAMAAAQTNTNATVDNIYTCIQLIALFHGWQLRGINFQDEPILICEAGLIGNLRCISLGDMKYHKSWDWLMPVWSKLIQYITKMRMSFHPKRHPDHQELHEIEINFKQALFENSPQEAMMQVAIGVMWHNRLNKIT